MAKTELIRAIITGVIAVLMPQSRKYVQAVTSLIRYGTMTG